MKYAQVINELTQKKKSRRKKSQFTYYDLMLSLNIFIYDEQISA